MLHQRRYRPPIEYYLQSDCPYPWKPWREAREPGWYGTDDGYVCKVIKVVPIREKQRKATRYRIVFEYGAGYAHNKYPYELMPRLENKASGYRNIPWWQGLARDEPGLVTRIALLTIAGEFKLGNKRYNKRQYEFLQQLGMMFFGSESRWRHIRTFMNHDEVVKVLQERVNRLMDEYGINEKKIFQLLKEAEDKALNQVDKQGNVGNPTAILAVVDRYAGLVGVNFRQGKPTKELPSNGSGEIPSSTGTHFDSLLTENTDEPIQS